MHQGGENCRALCEQGGFECRNQDGRNGAGEQRGENGAGALAEGTGGNAGRGDEAEDCARVSRGAGLGEEGH